MEDLNKNLFVKLTKTPEGELRLDVKSNNSIGEKVILGLHDIQSFIKLNSSEGKHLIGHGVIQEIPNLPYNSNIIDTLPLSWYLYFDLKAT